MRLRTLNPIMILITMMMTTINSAPDLRIIGGDDSDKGEFPYYVSLGDCGASLISPSVVLTAAHCALNLVGSDIIIGAVDHGEVSAGAIKRKVKAELEHPDYNDLSLVHDYRLIQLAEPIELDTDIVLVLNEEKNVPFDGQDLTVIGMGVTEGGVLSSTLKDVEVQAVSHEICDLQYGYGRVEEEVMFCAGVEGGGKDACQGDSGGPIVVKDGNRHIQVGIVSWGEGCGKASHAGVYARISGVMDWVKNIVCVCWELSKEANFCDDYTSIAQLECPTSPPSHYIDPSCQDTPGWTDSWGDGCDWYEISDTTGCPLWGYSEPGALENCCHCLGGVPSRPNLAPTISSATGVPTTSSIDPLCQDLPFVDFAGDNCDWYTEFAIQGCPDYGNIIGGIGYLDYTASSRCCRCGGGITSGTRHPTLSPSKFFIPNDCQDLEGFIDFHGDGCKWYEKHEFPGCFEYGDFEGGSGYEGITAKEACCYCGRVNYYTSPTPTAPFKPSETTADSTTGNTVDQSGSTAVSKWIVGVLPSCAAISMILSFL